MADALEIASRNARVATDRRARMPVCSAILDDVRKDFPDARMVWAREGQERFRAPDPDEGVAPVVERGIAPEEFERLKKRVRRAG